MKRHFSPPSGQILPLFLRLKGLLETQEPMKFSPFNVLKNLLGDKPMKCLVIEPSLEFYWHDFLVKAPYLEGRG